MPKVIIIFYYTKQHPLTGQVSKNYVNKKNRSQRTSEQKAINILSYAVTELLERRWGIMGVPLEYRWSPIGRRWSSLECRWNVFRVSAIAVSNP